MDFLLPRDYIPYMIIREPSIKIVYPTEKMKDLISREVFQLFSHINCINNDAIDFRRFTYMSIGLAGKYGYLLALAILVIIGIRYQ